MIAGLKPYRAMRDSGVQWLGAVPEHWNVLRTKTLLRERVQKGFPEEPLLAATQTKGVVRKDQYENRTVLALKDLHLLKLVRVSDFVISLRSFQGGIEYAREQGIISPAYTVLYPTQPETHGFLAWLFKSKPYIENLSLHVTGIRQGQNIDYDRLGRSELPFPPLAEQAAIVRFLDHADRRIRRYIRTKQKVIKLLDEQKRAIIDRAVTRGLHSGVRVKPSGIDWLEEIPEHWTVARFKFETEQIVDCLHATPEYSEDGDYPAVRTADIEPGKVRLGAARRVSRDQYDLWTSRLVPEAGDVLYSREGERFGIAALVPDGARLCISQRMMVFRIRPSVDSGFVMWQLNARHVYAQAASDVIGATSPHVNIERIKNFWIVVPPFEEQRAIAAYITERCAGLDAIADRIEREIALVREYRGRFIADVVTGKLDVRGAALSLLNEAPETDEPEVSSKSVHEIEEDEEGQLGAELEEVEA